MRAVDDIDDSYVRWLFAPISLDFGRSSFSGKLLQQIL
jgi:hypothetical protein